MEVLILAFLLVYLIITIKQSKDKQYKAQVEANKQFDIGCCKYANRQLLSSLGDDLFKRTFGIEQYNEVIAGTDTKMVKEMKGI